MAIAHVQSRGVQGAGVSSLALAYLADVSAGNLLLACTLPRFAVTLSVEGPALATWRNGPVLIAGRIGQWWHWIKPTFGEPVTVTAQFDPACDAALLIFEYSGFPDVDALVGDVAKGPFYRTSLLGTEINTAGSTVATPRLQTLPGSADDVLVLAAVGYDNTFGTITPEGGWTQRLEDETSPVAYSCLEKILPHPVDEDASWTLGTIGTTFVCTYIGALGAKPYPRYPRQEPLTRR